jgi:hypothetical protein
MGYDPRQDENVPGTRYITGKTLVPFRGPKPPKRAPGEAMGKAGNYVAPVDTTGMDPDMKITLMGTNSTGSRRSPSTTKDK